ncbi:MAG: ribosome silencing factor [Desulfitobacteriaceae bacterium]|nr:ribosome silencing factor [Desulfitobacteriaceae bacterium]
MTSKEMALACAEAANEKKARDILLMNLQGISLIADYFVICTGNNNIQVQAISDNIEEKLKEKGNPPLRREGYKDGRWVLMDFGSAIVHIFQEEERQYYNLERLWGDAEKIFYEEQK